ncbi:hypothetical protein [Halorubrum sp. Boch-26]|uniref:hypothetical protein n=1 Tax=Halorubrum sp. Boch-26 TaxID=2994426 RepID=UPI0024691405|nr:hypothetical protein [Halorubrum sp. Boch-26]
MVPNVAQSQDGEKLRVLFVGTPPINLQEACDESCTRPVDIDVVTDGREAIQWLTDTSDGEPSVDQPRPDLVLLQFDFELPDGMTVLHAIKSSPRLETLPVIVLNPDESNVDMTYEAGGNAHVKIPQTSERYVDLIGSIEQFWFEWAEYPAESLYSAE